MGGMAVEGEGVAGLAQRAAAGDAAAFTLLVERFGGEMVRVAYGVCGDIGLAEDAAQAAWTIAWRKLDRLRDPGQVRAWRPAASRWRRGSAARAAAMRERRLLRLTRDPVHAGARLRSVSAQAAVLRAMRASHVCFVQMSAVRSARAAAAASSAPNGDDSCSFGPGSSGNDARLRT